MLPPNCAMNCASLRRVPPCGFSGKPCDTAVVAMFREKRPASGRNLGPVLTFFCAAPSTRCTRDLMKPLNVSLKKVASVRYCGDGWLGCFRVSLPIVEVEGW